MSPFHDELRALLNRYSMERLSGTPDFILAQFLFGCLDAFGAAVREREEWHGRRFPAVLFDDTAAVVPPQDKETR